MFSKTIGVIYYYYYLFIYLFIYLFTFLVLSGEQLSYLSHW